MKKLYTRFYYSLSLLIFLSPFTLNAQSLTGIWRGYFITESYEQYKFELQIEQKSNSISGVSYSYLSTVFYGKATLTGVFNKSSKNALIQEIKTIELKMSKGSSACIMKCNFTYIKSGVEEFLEGEFNSFFEETDSLKGIRKGNDCGGGTVYLRKVATSDFYIEPFLRNYVKNEPLKFPPPKTTTSANSGAPLTTKKPPQKAKTPEQINQNSWNDKSETKITPKIIEAPIEIEIPKENNPEQSKSTLETPHELKTRTNELIKTLIISNPYITIKIYDNGEIDDDTVSVFLDKKLILSKQRLSASPLTLKIKMDNDNPYHELVMVAENLGRIPPNTSLMIVEAGEKSYDVRITSTKQKNAVVRFKYQKPD